jgi:hypothetical protein
MIPSPMALSMVDKMMLEVDDTPVWRVLNKDGKIEPVLSAWYTGHKEEDFLTAKTFGTKNEVDAWLKEFWQAYWRL